jgi:hypothetical protein
LENKFYIIPSNILNNPKVYSTYTEQKRTFNTSILQRDVSYVQSEKKKRKKVVTQTRIPKPQNLILMVQIPSGEKDI